MHRSCSAYSHSQIYGSPGGKTQTKTNPGKHRDFPYTLHNARRWSGGFPVSGQHGTVSTLGSICGMHKRALSDPGFALLRKTARSENRLECPVNAMKAGGREMNIFLMSLVATREPTSGSNEVEEKQQSRKASTAGRSAASPGRDAADGWERRKKNKTKHHAKVYIEAILCLVSTRIRRWWAWPGEEEGEKNFLKSLPSASVLQGFPRFIG